MPNSAGISYREYEALPPQAKFQILTLLEPIKGELHRHGFTLSFLGHEGRWKDLTPRKFLAKPEEHYERLIRGSKLVRPRTRDKMLDLISELYRLAVQCPKMQDQELNHWTSASTN